jgi:hypothetical protein
MSNTLYYGDYTGFYIDGIPFVPPQRFEPKLIYIEVEKRSLNNTLTVDRFDFEEKTEFDCEWSLTPDEFTQLKNWLNGDFYPVIFDINGNYQTLDLRFKYDSYEQIGERINLKATAKQK